MHDCMTICIQDVIRILTNTAKTIKGPNGRILVAESLLQDDKGGVSVVEKIKREIDVTMLIMTDHGKVRTWQAGAGNRLID